MAHINSLRPFAHYQILSEQLLTHHSCLITFLHDTSQRKKKPPGASAALCAADGDARCLATPRGGRGGPGRTWNLPKNAVTWLVLKWGNPANLCFPLNFPSKPPQEGYPHTNGKPMHIEESSFALFGVQEHLHGSLARLRVPSRPNVPFANRVPARCKTRRRLCGVKLSS